MRDNNKIVAAGASREDKALPEFRVHAVIGQPLGLDRDLGITKGGASRERHFQIRGRDDHNLQTS
jgi:hypothetical protein